MTALATLQTTLGTIFSQSGGNTAAAAGTAVGTAIDTYAIDPAGKGFIVAAGVAGGQTAEGGTAASETLTLRSTHHATKGKLLFGTSAYDEANNWLGVGTASPICTVDIRDTYGKFEFTSNTTGAYVNTEFYATSGTTSGKFVLKRSHNDTYGVVTQTVSTDYLGALIFQGANAAATNAFARGAKIHVEQNGTSGATYVPADLVISTSPGGTTDIVERIRVDKDGNVKIAGLAGSGTRALYVTADGTLTITGP